MANELPEPVIKVVYDANNVKIHAFISPEAFLSNATYIIESKNSLVLVDGQFIVPYAMQFREYADSLGKPIDRLYLSHGHPDHFFGVGAAFEDIQIYALPQTITFLEQAGEAIRANLAQSYGDFVAKKVIIPTHSVTAGTEIIDGVTYEFVEDDNTETDFHLSIKFPELGVFITQDLIYSGAHVYVTREMDNWINTLNEMMNSDYTLFLPGHGTPADKNEVLKVIGYLQTAQKALKETDNPEEFKNILMKAYPERTGAAIFDIYLPRLFGGGEEGHE